MAHTSSMAEYSSSSSSSSAAIDKVAANSNLLTEILIHLPIRSLMRFKSVAKHWLSLITSDSFSLRRNPDFVISGLFLHPYTTATIPKLDFVPLINTTENHACFNDLAFFPGLSGNIRILSSCRGLLLCYFYAEQSNSDPGYIILNPTTKQFKILPKRRLSSPVGLTLAFDPLKSPHYKIVCVCHILLESTFIGGPYDHFQDGIYHHVVMYSSETGSWKASGEPFAVAYNKENSGVYWNGAVHWFNYSDSGESHYYNVDEERMGIIPVPPEQECKRNCYGRERRQYGESGGHLHLVEIFDSCYCHRVVVYEMARDYSTWLAKYRVDDVVGIPRGSCSISVVCVVRMGRDEESFMVLHVPGKMLKYHFRDGNLKEVCDLAALVGLQNAGGREQDKLKYIWWYFYQYIESLCRV